LLSISGICSIVQAAGPGALNAKANNSCEVGDYEDRNYAEYCCSHTIQNLDRDQRDGIAGQRVENSAKEQCAEGDEQQRLSAPRSRLP
jgi:hypothetical protein